MTARDPESVWDYPRPPRLERVDRRVRIALGGATIVDTPDALRVLETSHPPTVYVPFDAFPDGTLRDAEGRSFCEWKGMARYHDLVAGDAVAARAGWSYPDPVPAYAAIAGHLAVYPSLVEACWIDDELVDAQEGDFYGGWITSELVGPFKGGPGTRGW